MEITVVFPLTVEFEEAGEEPQVVSLTAREAKELICQLLSSSEIDKAMWPACEVTRPDTGRIRY